ncbi:MAG: energy transducer TonB [Fidelibacterota bacterium]|nr:MAG: energy transducer TonB [Candidatus Neomarinimicrobiota bacterium]
MAIHRDSFVERYPLRVRFIIIGVIGFVVIIFYAFPRFLGERQIIEQSLDEVIETIDIPPTQQFEAPPPPSRPSIPVESEDEDIAEDITIEETELESFEWEAPPPPPDEGPTIRFIPYDEPPEPIGGYATIQKNVRYPEIAQEAGIEGTVIIQAFVDKNGRVQETVILKGIANTGLDEAASDAIRRTRWRPAKQRDRAVGVWISVPVNFKLKD